MDLGDSYFIDIGTPAALTRARDEWDMEVRAVIITQTRCGSASSAAAPTCPATTASTAAAC